jgi:hypothetical protein
LSNNRQSTPLYNVQQNHPNQNYHQEYKSNAETSHQDEKPNDQDHEVLTTSVVKVFKDHKCSHNKSSSDTEAKETIDHIQNQKKSPVESPNHNIPNIKHFGANQPLNYRGAVHYRVESARDNARSERYYYTTISPLKIRDSQEDGITRLVKSTQDLISNEDLLKINHAAEKHVHLHSDDILKPVKPRPRFSLRGEQSRHNAYDAPRSRITVKAKIGKIVDSEVQHDNNERLQSNLNEYRFASPIVVAEPSGNFQKQILNNIVSTMVPYIEDGYQILSVEKTFNKNQDNDLKEPNDNGVDVTPRPIGQKYLAPITVALRLLNANDNETLNRVEDHVASDSEHIVKKVQRPHKEKTVVEIQESIPVSITHINDVEVHEYLEDGKMNNKNPLHLALYNQYVDALESQKIHNDKHTSQNSNRYNNEEAQDNLEHSENRQSNVHVSFNEDASSERSEHVNLFSNYDNQRLIQPIIIEKEVPITKFVDRFIEKEVPYPEPVEIFKTVPVDRPVPYPVPYEKIVEKPVEVTKYVDKPYPVEYHHTYPVEVKVPYPVEQKVYVDRPIHIPYPVEKVIEKQVVQQVPVPTPVAVPIEVQVPVEQKVLYPIPIELPVAVPVEVEKPVPVERIVHKEVPVPYPVEKRVPYPVPYETKVPVPYPVEKRVPVPVEKIVEKPVTVTKYVEKPVHIQVPVPQPVPVAVHVPQPYPVDRIVEKKVPYPVHVDRIIEKKVPVKVPYPVQTFVEKIVEKPVVVTKYVDKPYPVEKRVPYPVEKIVEKKVPYPVQVPYEVKVPYPVDRIVEKPVPVNVPYPVERIVDRPYAVYNYGYQSQQTQNLPQYTKYLDQQKQYSNQNQVRNVQQNQYQVNGQYIKERPMYPIQSTHWGNQYASSYQYVNGTQPDLKRSLGEYLNYMHGGQKYYGPPPLQNYDDWWEKNKDYVVEMKVRRTDRTPKMTKLRIEYGGFKPPLIPSTEVDLDGIPVKKDEQS